MPAKENMPVGIRYWADEDLPLLERLMGDAATTGQLGGPETREQVRARHERYVHSRETSRQGPMFAITVGKDATAVGSIGYWQRTWQGQQLWEVRWSVLGEYQGQGIGSQALLLLVDRARRLGKTRFLHAFPAADHALANEVCRQAGFKLLGEVDFEFAPGQTRRRNDWRIDLYGGIG
jgi:RimJ/RimL family protein N-acetyltransferase